MDCDHDWHRSPFRLTMSARAGMARTIHAAVVVELCTKCGVLRIDPADAARLLKR